MNERPVPIGISEQIMRRACAGMKITVSFIDDQSDIVALCQIVKGAQKRGGVFDTCGVVGADQHDGACARRDKGGRPVRIGQQVIARGQIDRAHPLHIQPHLVIEIEGQGQDHLVARTRQCRHHRRKGLVASRRDRHLAGGDRTTIARRPLLRQFGAQRVHAQNGSVKMACRIVDHRLGHGAHQTFGRGIDGGGLAEIDQRAFSRELLPRDPAPRLHHRGGEGFHIGRIDRFHACPSTA